MCKTYRTVGSLKILLLELRKNNLSEFQTLSDVLDFIRFYPSKRLDVFSNHENLIEQERNKLASEVELLAEEIKIQRQFNADKLTKEINSLKSTLEQLENLKTTKLFSQLITSGKKYFLNRRIKRKKSEFTDSIEYAIFPLVASFKEKNERLVFLNSNPKDAIVQSAKNDLSELKRKRLILDDLSNLIYGAVGEQKVERALQNLSDDYYLINDFCISFSKPIFNRRENEYINSVQIDHILIAPSGVFVIETKNWSEKSMSDSNLYSPIQQIKRGNFAVYKLLNSKNNNLLSKLSDALLGKKKVPIRSLVVFMHDKPQEDFQYVKVLNLNELLSYIRCFKPIFTNNETAQLAELLLRAC